MKVCIVSQVNKVKDAKGVCGDLSQMIWGGEGVNGADSAGDQQEIKMILDGVRMSGLFFQHFSLNSRQNKLKDLAKLKDFLLNSSIFLPKLKFSAILRY